MEMAVQVNGKTRAASVRVARDAGEDEAVAAALADEAVSGSSTGRNIRKRIFVPNRLLNLVVQ